MDIKNNQSPDVRGNEVERGVMCEAEIKEAFRKEFTSAYIFAKQCTTEEVDVEELLWMAFAHGFKAGFERKNA